MKLTDDSFLLQEYEDYAKVEEFLWFLHYIINLTESPECGKIHTMRELALAISTRCGDIYCVSCEAKFDRCSCDDDYHRSHYDDYEPDWESKSDSTNKAK